jgi:hypothetical protein
MSPPELCRIVAATAKPPSWFGQRALARLRCQPAPASGVDDPLGLGQPVGRRRWTGLQDQARLELMQLGIPNRQAPSPNGSRRHSFGPKRLPRRGSSRRHGPVHRALIRRGSYYVPTLFSGRTSFPVRFLMPLS